MKTNNSGIRTTTTMFFLFYCCCFFFFLFLERVVQAPMTDAERAKARAEHDADVRTIMMMEIKVPNDRAFEAMKRVILEQHDPPLMYLQLVTTCAYALRLDVHPPFKLVSEDDLIACWYVVRGMSEMFDALLRRYDRSADAADGLSISVIGNVRERFASELNRTRSLIVKTDRSFAKVQQQANTQSSGSGGNAGLLVEQDWLSILQQQHIGGGGGGGGGDDEEQDSITRVYWNVIYGKKKKRDRMRLCRQIFNRRNEPGSPVCANLLVMHLHFMLLNAGEWSPMMAGFLNKIANAVSEFDQEAMRKIFSNDDLTTYIEENIKTIAAIPKMEVATTTSGGRSSNSSCNAAGWWDWPFLDKMPQYFIMLHACWFGSSNRGPTNDDDDDDDRSARAIGSNSAISDRFSGRFSGRLGSVQAYDAAFHSLSIGDSVFGQNAGASESGRNLVGGAATNHDDDRQYRAFGRSGSITLQRDSNRYSDRHDWENTESKIPSWLENLVSYVGDGITGTSGYHHVPNTETTTTTQYPTSGPLNEYPSDGRSVDHSGNLYHGSTTTSAADTNSGPISLGDTSIDRRAQEFIEQQHKNAWLEEIRRVRAEEERQLRKQEAEREMQLGRRHTFPPTNPRSRFSAGEGTPLRSPSVSSPLLGRRKSSGSSGSGSSLLRMICCTKSNTDSCRFDRGKIRF